MVDKTDSQKSEHSPSADEERILQLIGDGKKITAIQELKEVTGWPLKECKDWVDGVGIPRALEWRSGTEDMQEAPCPYCGLPLRTPLAKQCRHCRRDWHDPDHLKWLGQES